MRKAKKATETAATRCCCSYRATPKVLLVRQGCAGVRYHSGAASGAAELIPPARASRARYASCFCLQSVHAAALPSCGNPSPNTPVSGRGALHS